MLQAASRSHAVFQLRVTRKLKAQPHVSGPTVDGFELFILEGNPSIFLGELCIFQETTYVYWKTKHVYRKIVFV